MIGIDMFLIDDYDLGRSNRTGTTVLLGDKIALIETCASPSLPYIIEGLMHLHISTNDIAYIIVTHIHLDHAGAAGLLMALCPNATLLVHPRGARHLIDPSRLISGAQAVYGDRFDPLFGPIVPVAKNRIITMQDGDFLQLSNERTLTFYDTPGHAKHHLSIHDSLTNGVFVGDTIGVYYKELQDCKVELYLPSTSPSQFDPAAMLHSLQRIMDLRPEYIFFGHYGASTNVKEIASQLAYWLPRFMEEGTSIAQREIENPHIVSLLSEQMLYGVATYLTGKNVPSTHTVYEILKLDMEVCAMGILDYLTKLKA